MVTQVIAMAPRRPPKRRMLTWSPMACMTEPAPRKSWALKKAVGEQVEDGEGVADRAQARAQHHVADLAHGGGGQDLLHVVLRASDDGTPAAG